jgi:two-component system, OmpR family, response regulator MprA
VVGRPGAESADAGAAGPPCREPLLSGSLEAELGLSGQRRANRSHAGIHLLGEQVMPTSLRLPAPPRKNVERLDRRLHRPDLSRPDLSRADLSRAEADAVAEPDGGPSILVVDDEPAIRDALRMILTQRGYRVLLAGDGEEALSMVASLRPDLVILDILLPHLDGLTACRRLRAGGDEVPVLMLTARDSVGDRVAGLETGADDYVVKPFASEELVARIHALLRRSRYNTARQGPVLAFAGLCMDTIRRTVTRDGRHLRLTRTEFDLLELFLARPCQVLKRQWLRQAMWGERGLPTANNLDVYVMYVRRKMEEGGRPRLLHTIRGVGYVLDGGSPVAVNR